MPKLTILVILIILPLSLQSNSSSNIDLDLIQGTDIFVIGDSNTVLSNITINSEFIALEINDVTKSTYNGLDSLGRMEFNETRHTFDTGGQEHAKMYIDPVTAAMDIDCQTDTFGDPASMSYDFWPDADQFVNGSHIFEGNYYNFTIIDSGVFQLGNTSIETWIANGRALNNFVDIDITMIIMKSNGLTLAFNGYADTSGIYTCDGTYSTGSQRIEINLTTVGLQLINYGINTTSAYEEYLEFDSTGISSDPITSTSSTTTSLTSTDKTTLSTTTTSTTTISSTSTATTATSKLTSTSSLVPTNTPNDSNDTLETSSDPLSQTSEDTLELPFNYLIGIYSFILLITLRKFKS